MKSKKDGVQAPCKCVIIYTGKEKLDQSISTMLQREFTLQGLNSIEICAFDNNTDAINGLNNCRNVAIAVVKPAGDGGRLDVALHARKASIPTIIWTRHGHFIDWCRMMHAMFVKIPPIKNGSQQNIPYLVMMIVSSILTRDDVLNQKHKITDLPV